MAIVQCFLDTALASPLMASIPAAGGQAGQRLPVGQGRLKISTYVQQRCGQKDSVSRASAKAVCLSQCQQNHPVMPGSLQRLRLGRRVHGIPSKAWPSFSSTHMARDALQAGWDHGGRRTTRETWTDSQSMCRASIAKRRLCVWWGRGGFCIRVHWKTRAGLKPGALLPAIQSSPEPVQRWGANAEAARSQLHVPIGPSRLRTWIVRPSANVFRRM